MAATAPSDTSGPVLRRMGLLNGCADQKAVTVIAFPSSNRSENLTSFTTSLIVSPALQQVPVPITSVCAARRKKMKRHFGIRDRSRTSASFLIMSSPSTQKPSKRSKSSGPQSELLGDCGVRQGELKKAAFHCSVTNAARYLAGDHGS